jgi:methylenetetrahydrofolate reductase (NADPH)
MLKYMNANVPGIEVPEEMIKRMKDAEDPKAEGIKITLELIDAVKNLSGAKGVHLQAIEAEGLLPDVIKAAGLLPRPHIY